MDKIMLIPIRVVALIFLLPALLLPTSFSPLFDGAGGIALYRQGHAANLRDFDREFEVTIDSGISLSGKMTQELRRDDRRPGRWIFSSQIKVWGISASETSVFTNANNILVPLFYRLQVPFSDAVEEEFSGRTTGFDRLNVLLQFEQDFASNIDNKVWKYKVLNDPRPYSVQFRSHQSVRIPSGAVMRCKMFEVIHGSRRQLRTRFWMDIDNKQLIQIEHIEADYTYKAVRSDIT